jgi:predicted O-linked N-acetylglucosamine transferase (SPINDLY family)
MTGLLAAGLCLAACGSNAALLAERKRGEAEHLQEYCRQAGLATEETKRADGYLTQAQKSLKDGDEEPAREKADLSVTLFRLALARKELADTQAQVLALKQSLSKDQDQLATYQEILEEIKTRRKP